MKQNICNKCGKIIEGTEKRGKIKKETIPLYPWRVEITTKYWKGYEFELCSVCKGKLLKSLKHSAETYDC